MPNLLVRRERRPSPASIMRSKANVRVRTQLDRLLDHKVGVESTVYRNGPENLFHELVHAPAPIVSDPFYFAFVYVTTAEPGWSFIVTSRPSCISSRPVTVRAAPLSRSVTV